jgi:VIT1/CCC1 family predicted Fe2+/Mn2+ transporter
MHKKHVATRFNRNRTNERSNALRAAVLGANDGIISIAGLVIGIAAATSSKQLVLTAGVAGIVAGAMSIAVGEYVSVSTQRDVEKSLLEQERKALREQPDEELELLTEELEVEGVRPYKSKHIAQELTTANAYLVHAATDFHIDPRHLTNPWSSVIASACAFVLGALIPLGFIMLPTGQFTEIVVFISVVVALTISGIFSSIVSESSRKISSTLRVVAGGVIAMTVTYTLGTIVHNF